MLHRDTCFIGGFEVNLQFKITIFITIDSPLDNTYEGYFDIIILNTNDKN